MSCVIPTLRRPYLKITVNAGSFRTTIKPFEIGLMNNEYSSILFRPVVIKQKCLKKLKIVLKDRVIFGRDKSVGKFQAIIRDIAQTPFFRRLQTSVQNLTP